MAKILLIDDSKTLLKTITRMLVAGGHEVIAHHNGRTAVDYLKANAADIVLTDLYMPHTDGFEVVQHVRGLAQPPRLIVMSSNDLAYSVFRNAQALGACAALHKPFTKDQLLAMIDAVLRSAGNVSPAQEATPLEVAI
jgi:DNA-binding response OmpR family regulator